MENRPGLDTQRPPPPQRTLSGSHALQQGLRRLPLPSRLNNVRSVSHPVDVVDLTGNGAQPAEARNTAAFLSNQDPAFTTTTTSSSSSPIVISVSDDETDRPLKRAKTNSGHGFRPAGDGDESAEAWRDTAHQPLPGSPLPHIRTSNTTTTRLAAHRSRRPAVDRLARRANGMEPPSIATPLPSPRHVADFSPWNGNHPEDQLGETVVKAGYFDKPPGPNSTEPNSAKPSIWPNLSQKNNMGLQTLSYLFTSVMEKRQALGRCTAPSTFKPPPRVTVTDSKREAWLRDLANPDVPLRKQSRTIPHGIRGKILMEQCLSKDIPMPRAVWLAKCVGANELRAFRRKGVSGAAAAGGEQKWVREWTIHVEQFLEGVIAACGRPEWQSKMDYAVKLATSFYLERLLERDHYLDWVVTSLSHASVDWLPIWVILVQLHWKDITAFGRRGRQLAEIILEKLHHVTAGYIRVTEPLRDHLKKLVAIMAVTNRGLLIIPRTWAKYQYLLAPKTLSDGNASFNSPAEKIAKRNGRLTGPLLRSAENTHCALLELYTVLDTVGTRIDIEELTATCLSVIADLSRLVSALLRWSASAFRTGASRIYLTSRIIARLHSGGHDTDEAVLDFLHTTDQPGLVVDHVHRTIVELTRANCFSAGRYLQWLMTTGAISSGEHSTLSTGLLAALPVKSLPAHLVNTRQMLLKRLDAPQDENDRIDRLASIVDSMNGTITISGGELMEQIQPLSGSARLELARHVSLQAAQHARERGITLGYFCTLRDILQCSNDSSTLADITYVAIDTDDTRLLATIADTLNLHIRVLATLGLLQRLVEHLVERYRIIRSQQALERTCILAISSLMKHFPDMVDFAQLLENDLAICEQQSSMAVCSPASDNLVSMQASSLDSDHDIDAVFASGNTMDEQLMQRVFSRVVQRAAKPSHPDPNVPSKLCSWFNQLRAVDIANFDQMTRKYLQTTLEESAERNVLPKVICALVASMCLQFGTVVDLAKDAKNPLAASTTIALLTSDVSVFGGLHATETFRLEVQQVQYLSESPGKVTLLLASAMEDANFDADHPGLINLVLDYAVTARDAIVKILIETSQSPIFMNNCDRVIRHILSLDGGNGIPHVKPGVKSIIALADSLSVVHRAVALSFYYSNSESSKAGGEDHELQDAVLEAIQKRCEVWPQLLAVSGAATVRRIYQWVREQVLDNLNRREDLVLSAQEEIDHYLDVLDVAYHGASEEDGATVIAAVMERLKDVEGRLSEEAAKEVGSDEKPSMHCLEVLLHLAILYGISPASDNDNLKHSRASLLAALCGLLVLPALQTQHLTLEYIHDVASAIADNVSVEVLQALAKNASHAIIKDPRLAAILGTTPSPDAWLALVSHSPPQGSQQQRVLMKQAGASASGQQQQQTGRPPVPVPPIAQSAPSLQKTTLRPAEMKTASFPLRRWEIISDATPTVGENDTSLSLSLFGARKV